MTSKYDPLQRFLRRRRQEDVRLTLDDVERIIGDLLPKAASHAAWWTNHPPRERGFIQCRAWLEAGYVAETLEPSRGVRFRRQVPMRGPG